MTVRQHRRSNPGGLTSWTRGPTLVAVPRVVVPLVVVLAGLSGCGETYIEQRATATTAPAVTPPSVTFAPVAADAPVDELLELLSVQMSGLSEQIINDDDTTATMGRIDELEALLDDALEQDPTTAGNVAAVISLARTGVDERHPADADKAARSLNAIIAARAN